MAARLGPYRLLPAAFNDPSNSPATARHLVLFCLLLVSFLPSPVSALQYVAGGQCESVCSDEVAGTLHSDVVCLDSEFANQPGSFFKQCVTCQLNSTSVDSATNETDVDWALFNLRYTLSNCMFAYPEERVSISSPCQVSCAPLQEVITSSIQNSTNTTDYSSDLGFCTAGRFDDTTINNCAFCYSFIPQQLFLGNFLQALHIACHTPPQVGKAFYPDGIAIFNESTIAGPTAPATKVATSSGLTGYRLALAIVLPVIGGVAILVAACFACWHFTRKRRASMAASGRMSRFHDGQNSDYSPMTPRTSPPQPYAWNEPAREMESISMVPKLSDPQGRHSLPQKKSPSALQGRWTQQNADEAEVPLNSEEKTSYVRDGAGSAAGLVQDPNLHDQYIGGENKSRPVSGSTPAQDGFAREQTQGGWSHEK